LFVTSFSGSRGLDIKSNLSSIVIVDILYANSSELVQAFGRGNRNVTGKPSDIHLFVKDSAVFTSIKEMLDNENIFAVSVQD
jgi:hypothetical protein